MFCLTDFVQGLSYKGVQDRQVSVVIFFFIRGESKKFVDFLNNFYN